MRLTTFVALGLFLGSFLVGCGRNQQMGPMPAAPVPVAASPAPAAGSPNQPMVAGGYPAGQPAVAPTGYAPALVPASPPPNYGGTYYDGNYPNYGDYGDLYGDGCDPVYGCDSFASGIATNAMVTAR